MIENGICFECNKPDDYVEDYSITKFCMICGMNFIGRIRFYIPIHLDGKATGMADSDILITFADKGQMVFNKRTGELIEFTLNNPEQPPETHQS